jgi:NAD/NADP transhydrogenase alpha subunit
MLDKVVAIATTLAIAVVITSAVLPGRESPAVITAIGNAYSNAALASEGQGSMH